MMIARRAGRLLNIRHWPADALLGRPMPIGGLVTLIVGGSFAYGTAMGSFAADGSVRGWQMLFSAIKSPLLLLATSGLSFPSFFVLNTVAGLREDMRLTMAALVRAQATLAVVLASLGPLTVVWYVSDATYEHAILFNAAMFALASLAAQLRLRQLYRPLIARDPRHRRMLVVWLATYAFVGIQLGWVLRPFIGQPHVPSELFRQSSWSNAYVAIWDILHRAMGSG